MYTLSYLHTDDRRLYNDSFFLDMLELLLAFSRAQMSHNQYIDCCPTFCDHRSLRNPLPIYQL